MYGEWPPYVSMAERRAKAKKEMEKLRKKGKNIYPVDIEGRTIATSFWGKGWCEHLESFMDYANRLPRGRTYVRNGSVCHLDIQPGRVEATVSGSRLYKVVITIDDLPKKTWKAIKQACAGQIGSMLELLQGKLSNEVMAIVANRETGLFPKPPEIKLMCNCPDWATMCKHVAAALYGVGNRLDAHPELLFLLRNVDAQELISAEMALPTTGSGEEALAADEISAIFDIDLDEAPPVSPAEKKQPVKQNKKRGRPTKSKSKAQTDAVPSAKKQKKPKMKLPNPEITGEWVKTLREGHGMTVARFARVFGVSGPSIYLWEATEGPLNVQSRTRNKLLKAWRALVEKE
jgi:uncharacterized Zn finger protein